MISKYASKILTEDQAQRVDHACRNLNSAGFDPWGMDPDTVKTAVAILAKIYTDYFRVETQGLDQLPSGRMLLVSNHSGQIPIDAVLITLSLILKGNPPRAVRSLFDRWVPTIPFISEFFTRCGQVVGDPQNCIDLLNHDQAVLVFPEGTRGSGKAFGQRYQLQRFGTGFVRIALEAKSPIVPVAVIGCEETYPQIYNFKTLAKILGVPYIPVTPFFPLLGPVGALPVPAKVSIRFGKPMFFDEDPDASDATIEKIVDQVKKSIQAEIKIGLKLRGEDILYGSGVDQK